MFTLLVYDYDSYHKVLGGRGIEVKVQSFCFGANVEVIELEMPKSKGKGKGKDKSNGGEDIERKETYPPVL